MMTKTHTHTQFQSTKIANDYYYLKRKELASKIRSSQAPVRKSFFFFFEKSQIPRISFKYSRNRIHFAIFIRSIVITIE